MGEGVADQNLIRKCCQLSLDPLRIDRVFWSRKVSEIQPELDPVTGIQLKWGDDKIGHK